MYGVIDRIEGDIAVIEFDSGEVKNILIKYIQGEILEGNVLYKKDNFYYIDIEETNKRRQEAESFLKIWE